MIGPRQIAIERQVLFDHDRAERDRGCRDMDAAAVIGKADGKPERVVQRRHRAQIDRRRIGRILGRAVQQRDPSAQLGPGLAVEQQVCKIGRRRPRVRVGEIAEGDDAERLLHFRQRRHAGRQDDRQSKARQMQQQRRVGEIARSNLQRRDADSADQMRRAVGIERGRHVGDAGGGAGRGDILLVGLAEFERAQHFEL